MPEGHLIHRYAARHTELLGGVRVRASSPQGRFRDGADRLDGRVCQRVDAHGKHLFTRFDEDVVLHIHLGQGGLFLEHAVDPVGGGLPAPRASVRLRLVGPRGAVDLIAPVVCEIVDERRAAKVVARLGPDPLLAGTDGHEAGARLRRSRRVVGAAVLDQSVWAGLGNAFRAELLYLSRLHPLRPAASLHEDEAASLWRLAREQMAVAFRAGRIATVDGVTAAKWVYKRESCLGCGAPVETGAVGGRTSYHCPREQLLG